MIIINIQSRIKKLKELMKEKGIAAYIIPSSDPHQSEYVAKHYQSRAYITGFTGSAGTAVITLDDAGLWTDGRYFVQAADQLRGTGVTLYRMGEEDVPSIEAFLKEKLSDESTIGFDGRLISVDYYRNLTSKIASKKFNYETNIDLFDQVWDDRPEIPTTPVISHETKYTGKTREEKIDEVINQMKEYGATHYLISSLDDIAWLYNIRGKDIQFNPLTIAYTILTENKNYLFIDESKLSDEIKSEFKKANVKVEPYESVKSFIEDIHLGTLLIDPSKTNIWLHHSMKVKTIEKTDITTHLKAIKNDTEVQNVRNVMVRDGIAVVKFIKWLKDTIKEKEITEIEASVKLESLRRLDEHFYDDSFSTISAYKENAAMPHYRATNENQATIKPKSLYLVDSGAQYYDGTTDITRTIAMGELTKEEKTDFTLVLKGMINLTQQKFLYGTTGSNLDIIARAPLWQAGIDYKHGTGHGVGFFLNVHEGPQRIAMIPNKIKLEKGMIISNEPGVYKSGSHGIRIENLIVVQDDKRTPFGQFMKFETLTLCPIDLDAIDETLLTPIEKAWLNNYHQLVYKKLAPHLSEEEASFLKDNTQAI